MVVAMVVVMVVVAEESAGVVAGLSPISYRPACLLFHPTRLPGFVLMVYLDVPRTESTVSSVCLKREFLEWSVERRKGKPSREESVPSGMLYSPPRMLFIEKLKANARDGRKINEAFTVARSITGEGCSSAEKLGNPE